MTPEDERWMDEAIAQAEVGRPRSGPRVGAVLVQRGAVLASAHGDDAALRALASAGAAAAGASLYVTLEPRAEDALQAIAASGLRRLVIGCSEPGAAGDDGGLEQRFASAPVEVTRGVREAEARATVAPWAKHRATGLPYVSLKLALSLDGRSATRTGASKWITGPGARSKGHLLRARNDGCAVGIGTALADDPHLTVRDVPGETPLRVVFDTHLRLPTGSHLARTARELPTVVCCGPLASRDAERALEATSVTCLRVPVSAEGRLDVRAALQALAQRGVVSLMVEGGAALAGSLLEARLVDELHVFVAPMLLGPRARAGAVDWAGPDAPIDAPRIASPSWEIIGADAYVHGAVVYPDVR